MGGESETPPRGDEAIACCRRRRVCAPAAVVGDGDGYAPWTPGAAPVPAARASCPTSTCLRARTGPAGSAVLAVRRPHAANGARSGRPNAGARHARHATQRAQHAPVAGRTVEQRLPQLHVLRLVGVWVCGKPLPDALDRLRGDAMRQPSIAARACTPYHDTTHGRRAVPTAPMTQPLTHLVPDALVCGEHTQKQQR